MPIALVALTYFRFMAAVLPDVVRRMAHAPERHAANHAFSSPEAGILLVCARNRDLWPLPNSEHAQSTRSAFFSQSDLLYLTMSL